MAGRTLLGGAEAPCRSGRRRSDYHRTGARKEYRASEKFRCRAAEVWEALSGRRCGAHRSSDGCKGTEPGGQRCVLSVGSSRRILSIVVRGRPRSIFGARSTAYLGFRAIFLVDDGSTSPANPLFGVLVPNSG